MASSSHQSRSDRAEDDSIQIDARNRPNSKLAVVTGGSSGFGAAAVELLSARGWNVIAGARRLDRLQEVCQPASAVALPLDVTDRTSVKTFCRAVGEQAETNGLRLLVNNAGAALGLDPVASAPEELWSMMLETNIMGVVRLTKGLLPALIGSGNGHIINIGSIAGFETYSGGAGYAASKHGLRALTKTLRVELLGQPVRVTEVAPGMAETEFSLVRFDGDQERARAVYAGVQPLTATDIAECIVWAAERPPHVNIDEIVVRPRDQATATAVHRRTDSPRE